MILVTLFFYGEKIQGAFEIKGLSSKARAQGDTNAISSIYELYCNSQERISHWLTKSRDYAAAAAF